jgi:hypothetical protein
VLVEVFGLSASIINLLEVGHVVALTCTGHTPALGTPRLAHHRAFLFPLFNFMFRSSAISDQVSNRAQPRHNTITTIPVDIHEGLESLCARRLFVHDLYVLQPFLLPFVRDPWSWLPVIRCINFPSIPVYDRRGRHLRPLVWPPDASKLMETMLLDDSSPYTAPPEPPIAPRSFNCSPSSISLASIADPSRMRQS